MDERPTRYTGKIAAISMAEMDNDKVRYLTIALDVHPIPPEGRPVLAINPHRDFAAQCAGDAFVAWGRDLLVHVFVDLDDPANPGTRAREIQPVREREYGG